MAVVRATEQERLKESALSLVQQAERLEVTDAPSYEVVVEFMKACDRREKEINSLMDPICKAADMAHKEAVSQRNAMRKPITDAKQIASAKAGAYQARCEKERRELEEAERERLRKEAEEAIEQGCLELEAEGRGEEAAELMGQALECIPEPVVKSTAPKVEGTRTVSTWKYRVTNEFLVPRQYLCLDDKRIGQVVRRDKETTQIPGIEAYPETKVHASGR